MAEGSVFYLFIEILLLATIVLAKKEDNCQKYSNHHVLCKYGPNCPVQGTCADCEQFPLTDEEIELIVKAHNRYRYQIALGHDGHPTAANMNQLIWDDELAIIAQCWANQCQLEKDPHAHTSDDEPIGQSIGVTINIENGICQSPEALEEMIKMWYKQGESYDPEKLDMFVPNACGQRKTDGFTQLAWAETEKLGCGRVMNNSGGVFKAYLFCNYLPKGNIPGRPVYIKGVPGSKCKGDRFNENPKHAPTFRLHGLCT